MDRRDCNSCPKLACLYDLSVGKVVDYCEYGDFIFSPYKLSILKKCPRKEG